MPAGTLNQPPATFAQDDAPGAQASPASDTRVGDPASIARQSAKWIWQPPRPLPNAHLAMGPEPETTVAQNGVSGRDFTGYQKHSLGSTPQLVHLTAVRTRERFVALVKWIGRVQRVEADTFVAIVEDQTAPGPSEEVEFERSEITPADESLLRPGAVFYWTIGYRDRLGGPRRRESVIQFRRLPPPTEEEWTEADAWADNVLTLTRGD